MVHTSPLMLKEPKGEPIPSPPSLHFVRSESPPRKVGLTPRLHRRRRDDAQCNLRSCSSSNNNSNNNNNNFYSAVDEHIPTVASPPHNNKAVQKETDGRDEGEETEYVFTLTPTVLYGVTEEERAAEDHHSRRAQTVEVKRYHRSPHWSGKVNINPFSPVPEQYLCATSNSPSSEKKSGFDNDACDAIGKTTKAKRARLSPTKIAKSVAINGGGVNFYPRGLQQATERKRKVNYSIHDTTHNEGANNKRICLPNERSRYLDDFEEIQFLGAGSFGTVCACLSRLDGCMYAIKSISPDGHVVPRRNNDDNNNLLSPNSFYGGRNCSKTTLAPPTPRRDGIPSSARRHKAQSRLSPNDEDMSQQMVLRGSSHWNDNALHRMLREVFALAALCNQSDCRTFHIVRYHQAWLEDDGTLYIQTELCKSTLRDEMKSGVMSVSRQFKILREVLLALELVHEQRCVHLDIKPENIFVKDNVYKLGDFGTATLRNEKMNAGTGGKLMDVEEGDSRYMPRDLLEDNAEHQDLTKSDIFSLGITMYETCIDRPLPICGQEWQDLRDGKFPKPAGINPTLYFILKQMMHPDASKRPSATDLLSRSELSANSDNIFLSLARNALPKRTRSLPLKRSASWTL